MPDLIAAREYISRAEIDYLHSVSKPFHQLFLLPGNPWVTFYRIPGRGYLISFQQLADFTISSDGRTIGIYVKLGTSAHTAEHLYLNQVLPLALSRQFRLVLHGAAIEVKRESIVLVGLSGRGKSTLTASFAHAGHRFLTDDGLLLSFVDNRYQAHPSHPSIRLWEDSRDALLPVCTHEAPSLDYTRKARLLLESMADFCPVPLSIKVLYVLGDGQKNSVTIEPVSSRDAIVELVHHSFLLDIEEHEMLSHHFTQLTDLVKTVKVFRLDYPRRYDYLPEVRRAILEHAASL